MKVHQILEEIRSQLSPAAHQWFSGVSQAIEQEIIILAQRQGIPAAVAEVEALSVPRN